MGAEVSYMSRAPSQPFTCLPSVSFEQPTEWNAVLIISPVNISFIWILKAEACSHIWKESMSVERSVMKNHEYHSQVRVKEKWDVKKNHLYSDNYLAIGFTWTWEDCPLPLCIVCGKKLANTAMAPARLKWHFITNHSHISNKTVDYFLRLGFTAEAKIIFWKGYHQW